MDGGCPDRGQMSQISSDFVSQLESKLVSKLVSDVMTLKELREETADEESELNSLREQLQQETAFFFDLTSANGALDQMAAIVKLEEERLAEAQQELQSAHQAKETTKKAMDWVMREVERVRQENQQLEDKQKEWQDLQRKESDRVVGHMMRTKFRLDRDNRCVSLQLDSDRHVQSVILVPEKENAPLSHLTNTNFWDKLSKFYKL